MTRLIAFTGVDGAGKSTLMGLLKELGILRDAVFLKLKEKHNTDSVVKYHARLYGDRRDWLAGSFADSVSIATSLDFLRHYDTNIRPLFGHVAYIVCDRYDTCYRAYHRLIGSSYPIEHLLGRVQRADLTIHVECPLELLESRYESRGGAGEDEFPELMTLFQNAYLKEFEVSPDRVKRIVNGGAVNTALGNVVKSLAEAGYCREHSEVTLPSAALDRE